MNAAALQQLPGQTLKAELWARGELLWWKLHQGQLTIESAYQESRLVSKSKLFVADCSRQLGKTTWAVAKCLELALKKRRARIRYGTAFLSDLVDFVIPAFDLLLEDCPPKIRPVFRAHKSEYFFPSTGSRIKLVGLDRKPNGMRGNRLDMAVIEEAGFVSRLEYIYKFVLIPSTTHVPDASLIMISTQPESPDHDFVSFCDKAEALGAYVKLDIYKNPMLTQAAIDKLAEELGGYGSTAFRRECLCERVVEEGRALVPEFRETVHVTVSPRCPAWRFWHRLESMDSAGSTHKSGCLFGYYDFARAKLVIEGEYLLPGPETTTRRLAEETRGVEKELEHYDTVYRRVGDNNNPILLRDLGTEFDLHFAPTTKDELQAMVNKVRLWFGSGRIEIHPRCVNLIGALKAGIWNKQRTEFAESAKHGHFDLIAALVYMVRNVPEHENPVPPYFGQDLSNVYLPPHMRPGAVSRNADVFRKAAFGGGR